MKSLINFIFIFFLLLGVISCNNDDNSPSDNNCSITNPTGECKDNKSCINGQCIYECNEELACPDKNYHCEENICYNTTEPCSAINYFGTCSDNETCVEGICKNLNPCSLENPKGICSSDDRKCYNGICVNTTDECKPWNTSGKCPDAYYCENGYCKHDEIIGECSLQYLKGQCYSEFETCINGICMDNEYLCSEEEGKDDCPKGQTCVNGDCIALEEDPCSEQNFYGYCKNKDERCYRGICYNIENPCSEEDQYGKCSKNQICKEGICTNLVTECDENKECPDTNRQYCENNTCLDKPIFCEDGAENGLCPEGKSCVNSVCENITVECSPSNIEGSCNALNLKCIYGECKDFSQEGVCSVNVLNGKCPEGQLCNNGICEGTTTSMGIGNNCIMDSQCKDELFCEKTFLDGYCTKECESNSDCIDDSICYKISSSKGYCMAKCSVNIPNSCSRNNLENYICYPVQDNDGVCLYDCKYNHCFETNKTCNQVTGICQ